MNSWIIRFSSQDKMTHRTCTSHLKAHTLSFAFISRALATHCIYWVSLHSHHSVFTSSPLYNTLILPSNQRNQPLLNAMHLFSSITLHFSPLVSFYSFSETTQNGFCELAEHFINNTLNWLLRRSICTINNWQNELLAYYTPLKCIAYLFIVQMHECAFYGR